MKRKVYRRIWTALLPGLVWLAVACGNKPSYYRDDATRMEPGCRVAVLPLVNMTRDANAPDIVMNAFVVELLATHRFAVVDPGIVDDVIQRERIRLTDRISLEILQKIGATLEVDYVFAGSVNEYQMTRDAQDNVPDVAIALRMVACSTGTIVWAATHSRRGNDAESVFSLGRIESLEEMTAIAAREMAATVVPGPGKNNQQKKGSK